MIEVTHLTKKYGTHLAVDDISFTVNQGEILGFLGPNGAGKSTTMNMITGYLSSTSGTIKINGIDILENPLEAKKHIGYLPELPPLYLDMTVMDYLVFVCNLKKVAKKDIKEHLASIMSLVKIEDVAKRLIKNLSKGYKQRIGLAAALVGSPDVLILDEPTVGLDPKQIIEIRNLVKDLSRQHTIILSSHILSEVSALCDRIMIINKGTILACDTPENLRKRREGSTQTSLRVRTASKTFIKDLEAISQVYAVREIASSEVDTNEFIVEAEAGADVREAIFNVCAAHHNPLLMLEPHMASLEDIFLQVTESDAHESSDKSDDVSSSSDISENHGTAKSVETSTKVDEADDTQVLSKDGE